MKCPRFVKGERCHKILIFRGWLGKKQKFWYKCPDGHRYLTARVPQWLLTDEELGRNSGKRYSRGNVFCTRCARYFPQEECIVNEFGNLLCPIHFKFVRRNRRYG